MSPSPRGLPATSPLKKALFSLVTTVALLGLMEWASMWLAPQKPLDAGGHTAETAMRASDLLGWEAVPGRSHAFNVRQGTVVGPEGTRNPPAVERQAGSLRLMTLGDSSIYGVMVNDGQVFSDVAAKALGQSLGRTVDVVNGGVPGYSSEQARRLYATRLRKYKPDVLVVATIWSDSQLGPMPDVMMYPERGAATRRFLQNSALVRFVGGLLAGWVPGRDVAWKLSGEPGVRRVPLSAYRQNLRLLAEMAAEDGASTAFVLLPCDRDVTQQPVEAPRPEYRQVMREVAEETGSVLVDGVGPFQASGAGRRLFLDDVHPSVDGHRLLGQSLADALRPALSTTP